jgi:hypothetical protein
MTQHSHTLHYLHFTDSKKKLNGTEKLTDYGS